MAGESYDAWLSWMEDPERRKQLNEWAAEAARVTTPKGLARYLECLGTLHRLGRGWGPVEAFARNMPPVIKHLGEDTLDAAMESVMHLSGLTSGAVMGLVLSTLPIAAHRLGDTRMLQGYLAVVSDVASKAPRGLRPMLDVLEELLGKLTLGGLRRWVQFGLRTHGGDAEGLIAYFSLASASSRAVLDQERGGTLLADCQRRLGFYLRAFWNRSFHLRPIAADRQPRPFIEDWTLFLPDSYDDALGLSGLDLYRAAAAHGAAHLVYTRQSMPADTLTPQQQYAIALFEDARAEALAMREFPGLVKLWRPFHDAPLPQDPALAARRKLARALLTGDMGELDLRLAGIASDFMAKLDEGNQASLTHGLGFYDWLDRTTGLPGLRALETDESLIYRDDNRFIWEFDEAVFEAKGGSAGEKGPANQRIHVNVMEMVNAVDTETASDQVDEVWVLGTELFPYEDNGVSYNQSEGHEQVSDPVTYPEWDYQGQFMRPDWTTLTERQAHMGDPARIEDLPRRHRGVAARVRTIIDSLKPQGVVRKRGYEDGEAIDLDAAIRAMIDLRRGITPDPRISIRITRHTRDLSVVVLLDLSQSTTLPVHKDDPESPTILSLTQDASGLLAWALDRIGDNFALAGFASDGRHDVRYWRIKDFDQPYDSIAKARLAGLEGGLSTRMGAALRHAGHHLSKVPSKHRLVLLVTDGEPADIDEADPQHLRLDTKKAVEELAAKGIRTFCLTLDPLADRYVAGIFGDNSYAVVDNVDRLPDRLPSLFAHLTR